MLGGEVLRVKLSLEIGTLLVIVKGHTVLGLTETGEEAKDLGVFIFVDKVELLKVGIDI